MKKTDIGVVAFMYAICALFLVMTLRLPAAAQKQPPRKPPKYLMPAAI